MPAKPRKKPPPQTTRDYLTTLEHAIRQLAYSQHLFTVFRHFVELSAICLSNAADPINKAARAAQYMAIVPKYKPEEFRKFPELLALITRNNAGQLMTKSTNHQGGLHHRCAPPCHWISIASIRAVVMVRATDGRILFPLSPWRTPRPAGIRNHSRHTGESHSR